MPDGLLNMLKPPGMTSHDVVDGVRSIVGMRKVGHAGTLDPAAAGVMLLMLGDATRLSAYVTGCDKTYRAEITFGIATDTLDGEGRVVSRESAVAVTADDVQSALSGLTGELHLAPPMHSAVWHEGRRLYEIARAGETADVETREITVHRFDLLDFEGGRQARALTEVHCSSGTYVRSLAALAGEQVGCPAYLSFLVRTAVGEHFVADSLTGTELAQAADRGRLDDLLIPPRDALADWPTLEVNEETAHTLSCGGRTPAPPNLSTGERVAVISGERLLCVAEVIADGDQSLVQPRTVFSRRTGGTP